MSKSKKKSDKDNSNSQKILVVAVLGAGGSGKTTLCSTITESEPDYDAHLPVEYKTTIKEGSVIVFFKELHLEEEFYDLNRNELMTSDAIIGTFNTEDMSSLEFIAPTIQKLQNDGLPALPVALIAMNSLSPSREVLRKAAENTAKLLSLSYFEDGSPTMKSELFALLHRLEPKNDESYRQQFTIRKGKNNLKTSGRVATTKFNSPPVSVPVPSFKPIATIGKYDIVRLIGNGIEGKVYEAMEKDTGKIVALKELPHTTNTELQAKIMRELDHPHIVKCFGTFVDLSSSKRFLVMEFMQDGSLLDAIKKHPNLPQDEILSILRQVVSALEHMEEKKVLHRDIALRNVLVAIDPNNKWIVKMGDFGLARHQSPGSDEYAITTVRTPLPITQIPPEVIRTRRWNQKCEAWSFGVLVWELLSSGQAPYEGIENEIFQFLQEGKRLERPVQCSDKLWKLIQACWDQDPTERPTWKQMHKMLNNNPVSWRAALPKGPSKVTPPASPPPTQHINYGHLPSVEGRYSEVPFASKSNRTSLTMSQSAIPTTESPYSDIPPRPQKLQQAPSLEDMMNALAIPDESVNETTMVYDHFPSPQQHQAKPSTNYQALPLPPSPPVQHVTVTPFKVISAEQVEAPSVFIEPVTPTQVIEETVILTTASQEEAIPPPPGQSEIAPSVFVQPMNQTEVVEQTIAIAVMSPAAEVTPPTQIVQPVVVGPSPNPTATQLPVHTPPLPQSSGEYAIYHDGVEHCAVESLTPDMTLEQAREVLAQEVDFDIEKCNFFRTDTNHRVSMKQEKIFTVQKCSGGTFVLHLRTTS